MRKSGEDRHARIALLRIQRRIEELGAARSGMRAQLSGTGKGIATIGAELKPIRMSLAKHGGGISRAADAKRF